MKKHEWHSIYIGLLGFLVLVGYQNCSNVKEGKVTEESDIVASFSSVRCQVQNESPYNQPSETNFSEKIQDIFDIYYNDADCDSTVDALLINPQDFELSLICFNYQQYGFGNCYPQTQQALLCGKENPNCPINLKDTNGNVIQDIYLQQPRMPANNNTIQDVYGHGPRRPASTSNNTIQDVYLVYPRAKNTTQGSGTKDKFKEERDYYPYSNIQ